MSFLMKNDELLVADNEIWEKVGNIIKKEFAVNLYTEKNIWDLK